MYLSFRSSVVDCSFADNTTFTSVNSKSAFLIMKEGAKHVQDGGKIITIVTALLAAFTGFYTSYAGSKAPVEHFTRGVAKELSARGISVNAIGPGPMDTRESSPVSRITLWSLSVWLTILCLQPSSTRKNRMRQSPSIRARAWEAV